MKIAECVCLKRLEFWMNGCCEKQIRYVKSWQKENFCVIGFLMMQIDFKLKKIGTFYKTPENRMRDCERCIACLMIWKMSVWQGIRAIALHHNNWWFGEWNDEFRIGLTMAVTDMNKKVNWRVFKLFEKYLEQRLNNPPWTIRLHHDYFFWHGMPSF